MSANDRTYNGWTNYATWRVNLEMFDGQTLEDMGFSDIPDVWALSRHLESTATDYIIDQCCGGLAEDYALAFLGLVNWDEIARHFIDDATREERYQSALQEADAMMEAQA